MLEKYTQKLRALFEDVTEEVADRYAGFRQRKQRIDVSDGAGGHLTIWAPSGITTKQWSDLIMETSDKDVLPIREIERIHFYLMVQAKELLCEHPAEQVLEKLRTGDYEAVALPDFSNAKAPRLE